MLKFLNLITTPVAFFIMLVVYSIPAYLLEWSSNFVLIFFGLILLSFAIRRLIHLSK